MSGQNDSSKFYSGIGSRQTPPKYLKWMKEIGIYLEGKGYTLRSGNADGADSAFQRGVSNKEVYLPWPGYNGGSEASLLVPRSSLKECSDKVRNIHPNAAGLTTSSLSLHMRNVTILLGGDLKVPSKFVIYWNPGYKKSGGTYIAVELAKKEGINCYNLNNPKEVEELIWTFEFEDFPTLKEIES